MAKKKQCDRCKALCCKYFAFPIETPEDKGDYDDIRWYLCHKGVSVFVEDGDWYINIDNKCRYLSVKDHKCIIYDKRPRICRGYSMKDCDLSGGEYDYELHFTSDKQMEEYIEKKFSKTSKKGKSNLKRKAKKKVIK